MNFKPYTNRGKELVPLYQLLPLKVPFSIMIDPTNKCNFRCSFCPTGNPSLLNQVARPAGFMDMDLYVKIINDISSLCSTSNSRISRLYLYKDGEPLLNKKLPSMISHAKEMNISDSIETTTNAATLTEDRAVEIIESGLDVIRISIEHVNDDGYKQITKTFNNYNKILQNVRFLFQEKNRHRSKLHIHVKIVDDGLSDQEKIKFLEDFSEISDSIHIDALMGWSQSFEKTIEFNKIIQTGMDGFSKKTERKVCPEPFTRLAINFDGTVSVCCVDWSHGTVIGDLKESNITELWFGEKLRDFRLKHLQGKRCEIPACFGCDYIKGLPSTSDLDAHAQDLIAKFQ